MTKRRLSPSLLFSLAIHTVIAIALGNVVLHYDIFTPRVRPPAPEVERITYVTVGRPAGAVGGTEPTPPARATEPARGLVAPSRVPAAIAPATRAPVAGGTPGGVAGGAGAGGGRGVTTGIVPAEPDPRLAADSKFFYPAPKTHGQRVDSAIKATIYAFNDSVEAAAANAGKKPGDWTVERDGKKWGVDGSKIYLGKFSIPSAILAALPIRAQGNPGEGLSDRLAPSRRADIMLHAQSRLQGEEFKTAVKRIRERKERERRTKEKSNEGRGVAQSEAGGS